MDQSFSQHALHGWQECRRRAEIRISELEKEIESLEVFRPELNEEDPR